MNDGNESAWSGTWALLFLVTLVVGLPAAAQGHGAAGGWAVGGLLAFEYFMLALPWLWAGWKAGRPKRERRRAEARERAEQRERERLTREEARRQRLAEERARREARAAEERRRREARSARAEAEAHYRAHAGLLEDVLPPALFRAEVAALFPPEASPEAAWQASRDLIARMQPLVREARERRREGERRERERADRLRDIDAQIRARESRIRTLRAAGPDADFAEDEAAAEREFIDQLREQREAFSREAR